MKIETLIQRYGQHIKGSIECFDRLILFGSYRSIGWPDAMSKYLNWANVSFMQYNRSYANELRLGVANQIREMAGKRGIEIIQVNANDRKEQIVEKVLEKRGRKSGVVCILGAMEGCQHFKVGKDAKSGYLKLQWGRGKCQHYYIYVMDEDFGLCYLRVPTWVPFRLQFYCNGHDWLEREMKKQKIKYTKQDNCFTDISDFEKAQSLVKNFDIKQLHRKLDQLAGQWVSVHKLFGTSLHWSVYQAEWSKDIVFKDEQILADIYKQISRTAIMEVECGDVYRFMGKKLHSRSKQEVSSRLQTLVQGTRIKHKLGATSLKMYDKAKCVLRIECTTSDVTTFKHRRKVVPHQSSTKSSAGSGGSIKWAPMRKTLYSLKALGSSMSACTRRYLCFISQWRDQTSEQHQLEQITESTRDAKNRPVRGINFFKKDDLLFINALHQGENQIQGIRNKSLQSHLPEWKPSKISRTLRRFRTLNLIKTVAGTRKYYPTAKGEKLIIAGLQIKKRIILTALSS